MSRNLEGRAYHHPTSVVALSGAKPLVGQEARCDPANVKDAPLSGSISNSGTVVRVAGTVRRPAGVQSQTVFHLLSHLRGVGFEGAPKPLGFDDQEREVLEFIEGEVAVPPVPAWAATRRAVSSVGRLLRAFREAAASFAPTGDAQWFHRPPTAYAVGSVGHNDVCASNVVFRKGKAIALIDFDWAAPSDPIWDLATAAQHWGPIADPADFVGGFRSGEPFGRVQALVEGYGASSEQRERLPVAISDFLRWAAANVEAQARAGHPGFKELWGADYRARHERTLAWFQSNSTRLRESIG